MLQDYRNYIKNIRNGLIQCGVEVSISPLSTYRDLFYEADKLSQILWFYSIMEISGSPLALDDFFINLGKYYKEEMRNRFYVEFQDYLDSYKNISKLAYLAREDLESKYKNIELDETFDIFGDSEVNDSTDNLIDDEYKGYILDNESDEVLEEVHGTFLEDIDFYYNVDKVLGTGYIPSENIVESIVQGEVLEVHGTYVDEISTVITQNSNISNTLSEDSFEYETHGVILDDIEVSNSQDYDEDEVYDDINYSDEEEEEYDDINYSYDEEEDDDYCDINYSDDEEDGYSYQDDDDDYCDINYSDDEDEYFEEDEDDYCDINYADDEDEEDGMIVKPKVQHQQTSKQTTNIVQANVKQGDMSDVLQKGVNDILTRGKRFIMNRPDRLRDYDKK